VLWLALTAGSLGIELSVPYRSGEKASLKKLWQEKFHKADSTWRADYREAVAQAGARRAGRGANGDLAEDAEP
jgi:hypothetical protein